MTQIPMIKIQRKSEFCIHQDPHTMTIHGQTPRDIPHNHYCALKRLLGLTGEQAICKASTLLPRESRRDPGIVEY